MRFFIVTIATLVFVSGTKADLFADIVKDNENAVRTIANHVLRALGEPRCDSLETCSQNRCLYASCSGLFADPGKMQCKSGFIPKRNCARKDKDKDVNYTIMDYEEKCSASENPEELSINYDSPNVRIHRSKFTSQVRDNTSINIEETETKRDLCSIGKIQNKFKAVYEDNSLSHFYYVGTRNKAFVKYPSVATCRKEKQFGHDPFLSCSKYDPTTRPWYITAASGPRDVVFLVDRPLLATNSTLYDALKESSESELFAYFDSRDYFSVVLYGKDSAKVLPYGKNELNQKTDKVLDDLQKEIGKESPEESASIKFGLQKAFDVLGNSQRKGKTSGCGTNYIIIFQSKRDACFEEDECSLPSGQCNCVEDIINDVNRLQEELPEPGSASILTFTDYRDSGANNGFNSRLGDFERLAGSISCESNFGLWQKFNPESSSAISLPSFGQHASLSLKGDKETKVYSSGLYEDFSGYGFMFTIAKPIYISEILVGVAGSDILLDSVTEDGDKDGEKAKIKIKEYSNESRGLCPERVDKVPCNYQRLRQQYGRECPAIPPSGNDCYRIGDRNERYFKIESRMSFTDSIRSCANPEPSTSTAEVSLVTIDSQEEKIHLDGVYDRDGSWIGLRAKLEERFQWIDGSPMNETFLQEQFDYNVTEELEKLFTEFSSDICITGDRRATSKNWNMVPCSRLHSAICEAPSSSVASFCNSTYNLWLLKDNPTSPFKCGKNKPCSEDPDAFDSSPNPVCDQQGVDFTDVDRTCCDVRNPIPTSSESATPSHEPPGSNPNIGAIAGGSIGALVLLVLLVFSIRYFCGPKKANKPKPHLHPTPVDPPVVLPTTPVPVFDKRPEERDSFERV